LVCWIVVVVGCYRWVVVDGFCCYCLSLLVDFVVDGVLPIFQKLMNPDVFFINKTNGNDQNV